MVVIFKTAGAYLQKCLGGRRKADGAPRGELWLAGWRDADAMLTQCCGPSLVDWVHRSTVDRIKGVRALLMWAVQIRSGGGGRMQAGGEPRLPSRRRRVMPSAAPCQPARRRRPKGPSTTKRYRKNCQNEEEAKGISPGGSEGREEHRRSGSAARAELRWGAPAAPVT
jgi:hypothetical protein